MSTRNLIVLAGLLLAGVLLVILGQRGSQSGSARPAPAPATAAPVEGALPTPAGGTLNLADYRGKVVVVDVWATWCGYCVEEIPWLERMHTEAQSSGRPLQLVGLSVDEQRQAVAPFIQQHGITYPIAFADDAALAPLGRVSGLPTKFILDKSGKVVEKVVGATTRERLEALVKKYE